MTDLLCIGVDLGGAEASAYELLAEIEKTCSHLRLQLYVPSSLKKETLRLSSKHSVCFASQEVGMHDSPLFALYAKKDSSLMLGLRDLKEKKTSLFVSLANTGALVLSSMKILGKMKGVRCPALVAQFPSLDRDVAVLDLGAYPKHTKERLEELVCLGVAYVRDQFSKQGALQKPIVGLLNIGHEAGKGTEALRQADDHIKALASTDYVYVGFIEPIDIFRGCVDVAVTDGFTGNVLLKTAEGVQELLHTRSSKVSSYVRAGRLFGVNGLVYKCHGRTSPANLSDVVLRLFQSL